MDRSQLLAKVKIKLSSTYFLNTFEKIVPRLRSLSPDKLLEFLNRYKNQEKLTHEQLVDVMELLTRKYQIHKKNPEFKKELLNFAKENKILGLLF